MLVWSEDKFSMLGMGARACSREMCNSSHATISLLISSRLLWRSRSSLIFWGWRIFSLGSREELWRNNCWRLVEISLSFWVADECCGVERLILLAKKK